MALVRMLGALLAATCAAGTAGAVVNMQQRQRAAESARAAVRAADDAAWAAYDQRSYSAGTHIKVRDEARAGAACWELVKPHQTRANGIDPVKCKQGWRAAHGLSDDETFRRWRWDQVRRKDGMIVLSACNWDAWDPPAMTCDYTGAYYGPGKYPSGQPAPQ